MKFFLLATSVTLLSLTACDDKNAVDITPIKGESKLFISNTDPTRQWIGVLDVTNRDYSVGIDTFNNENPDANGIVVSKSKDLLMQVSRLNKTVLVYDRLNDFDSLARTPLTAFTLSALVSARGMTYDEIKDILYIASNTDSAIYVVNNPASKSGSIAADRVIKLNGEPWGIEIDASTNRLFVAKDKTAFFQLYYNASALSGRVIPSVETKITGAIRTHGITYSALRDMLVVSDVGNASSSTDGQLFVINDLTAKMVARQTTITPDNVIAGSATILGNPVDIKLDLRGGKNYILVSEKAGGFILGFNYFDNGNVAPKIIITYPYAPESLAFLSGR